MKTEKDSAQNNDVNLDFDDKKIGTTTKLIKEQKIKLNVTEKFDIITRQNSALVYSTYKIFIFTPQLASLSTKCLSVNPSMVMSA
jgi:hypothetical protein